MSLAIRVSRKLWCRYNILVFCSSTLQVPLYSVLWTPVYPQEMAAGPSGDQGDDSGGQGADQSPHERQR